MTTYQVSAITANSDIPGLVATFAAALGFTTTSVSATEKTVQHPTYTGAKVFTIRTNNTGSAATRRERIELTLNVSGVRVAWAESPVLNPTVGNTAAAVVCSQPTKLHLYGKLSGGSTDSGKSYIAGVIEYGFNLYRHFYLGYIEKLSAFNGGEVITGSSFCPVSTNTSAATTLQYDAISSGGILAYPFAALVSANTPTISNGGLYIDHPAKTNPWSSFYAGGGTFAQSDVSASMSAFGDALVLGGYSDSINSGYMMAAKSAYAGAQILTPINLYVGKRASNVQYFQAVGRPGGVRLVHMEDLEPGQQITIGTSVWRVFPVFSKSSSGSVTSPGFATVGSPQTFPAANTSFFVGMAYEEVE